MAATALLALGTLAGCSTPEPPPKEYATPTSLCGVPIDPALLDPLLPASGRKAVVKDSFPELKGGSDCTVVVDDSTDLSAITTWRELGTSVREIAAGQPYVRLDERISADLRYSWGDKGAVSKVDCPEPAETRRKGTQQLFVYVFVGNEGRANEAAMKKLILAYADAVSKSAECRGG
ncbi:hypothetical protein [Streptomyces lichenis]|uniref:DUF3558 domain-containing protein n=1 Tax=Streptomyces lichenis TaxID=2306967 RepID=A0ABT0IGE3_9ACTN|nr:hypothetical protein [Streptomyces lichenis]MCK8680408.1 hypothetical protein [Streptomyces lichenis]